MAERSARTDGAPGGARHRALREPETAYPGPVRTVEQIVEQIRAAAGADFAFVLTRKGRLVTYRAPRDMPEEGRDRLVRAARPLLGTDRVMALTLAREDLVPYGGAAPIDVYLGIAAEQAIVCVVMASWADKVRVAQSLSAGLLAIEPLLRRGLPTARRPGDLGPAKGAAWVGERRTMPPPSLSSAPPPSGEAALTLSLPRPESLPEIHVGEAELGRASMIAVHHDLRPSASSPEITYGDAELGRHSMVAVRRELLGLSSAPEIVVTGEAALGRESLDAILHEGKPRPTSSPEAIRVDLVSMPELELPGLEEGLSSGPGARGTMPWVEAPGDTKRSADAAAFARNLVPPRVTLKLEDADEGVIEATRAEMLAKSAPPADGAPHHPRAPQATRAYELGTALDAHAAALLPAARSPQATMAYEAGAALEAHARAPQVTMAYDSGAALEAHAPAVLSAVRAPQATLVFEPGSHPALPAPAAKPPPLPASASGGKAPRKPPPPPPAKVAKR
jgi:hypothetical protein